MGEVKQPAWVSRVLEGYGLPKWAKWLFVNPSGYGEVASVYAAQSKPWRSVLGGGGYYTAGKEKCICTVAEILIGDDERVWELKNE